MKVTRLHKERKENIHDVSWHVTGLSSLTVLVILSDLLTPKSATFRCPESSRRIFLLSYSFTMKKL